MPSGSGDAVGDFLSGVMAGTAGKLLDYPLDTVKTRLQAPGTPGQPKPYAGSWDCFTKIARTEGLRGFYGGIAAPVAGAAMEKAVVFSAYGTGKTMYDVVTGIKPAVDAAGHDSLARCIVGGGASGIATSIVLTPFELVKCSVQVNPGRWRGVVDCTRDIVATRGAFALTHGFSACVCREVFGNFFWFGCYEVSVRVMMPAGSRRDAAPWYVFPIAGGIGGVAFWTSAFPFDTVKTRAQVDDGFRRLGVVGGLRAVVREGGVAGLFAGWNVTALRAFPASAAIFAVYESFSAAWRATLHPEL